MNSSESKTFCPIPWINISADTDGSVRLCCTSDEYIYKQSGEKFNLGHDKIEDVINSECMTQIRQDMLSDKQVKGCYKCYAAEQNNGLSYRNIYKTTWNNDPSLKRKVEQSVNEEPLDTTVQYYDLRFGNLCNLACRSCYSTASSQFNKELKQMPEAVMKFHRVDDRDLNAWYDTEIFEYNMDSQLSNLREYYCTGGEPTINDKNYETLVKMIDSGHSKNITLRFNTNLTNTKKDFYALVPHFKKVIAMCSIDGYGAMQEYLRYPSAWPQIDANLNKLVNMQVNKQLIVNPVIQMANLGHIVDLFEYVESINRQHQKPILSISPIMLMDPPYLDFNFLPVEYKMECWSKIDKWMKDSCRYQGNVFYSRMLHLKVKCQTPVDYAANLRDFFEITAIYDSHRDQSIAKINPELSALAV